MKLVTAVIKPHKWEEVREALAAAGVAGMTVSEVRGFGRQGGHTETYRGAEYNVDLIPKLRVEVLCTPATTDAVVGAISGAANTGKIGDGKVWVMDVAQLLRIRTGEHDGDAI